jgi:hypothetical protein
MGGIPSPPIDLEAFKVERTAKVSSMVTEMEHSEFSGYGRSDGAISMPPEWKTEWKKSLKAVALSIALFFI